jgi:hypothetical protein
MGKEVLGFPSQIFYVNFAGLPEDRIQELTHGQGELVSDLDAVRPDDEFERMQFWGEGKYREMTWKEYRKGLKE